MVQLTLLLIFTIFMVYPVASATAVTASQWPTSAFNNKTDFFPFTGYYGVFQIMNLLEDWKANYRYCYISEPNGKMTLDYCQHACVMKVTFSLEYDKKTKKGHWSNSTSYHCQDIDTYPPKFHHVCSNMKKSYPNLKIYFNKRTFKKVHLYCCDSHLCNHPNAYQAIEAVPFKQGEHKEIEDYDLALFVTICLVLVVLVGWPFLRIYKVAKRDEWVTHAFYKRIEKAVVLMEYKQPNLSIEKLDEISGQLTFAELVKWFVDIKDYEPVEIPKRKVRFPKNSEIKVIDHVAGGHGHELVRANRRSWVRYDDTLQPERATMQTVLEHGPYAYDWKPIDLVELFDQAKEHFHADDVLVEISLPVVVIGDLRGHYTDLWRYLQIVGVPPKKKLLFLGGVIDPDEPGSLDTLALIAVMKVAFPTHVFMLRGVPESMKISFGARYGETNDAAIQSAATRLCAHLPIACRIHRRILAVHSGISHLLTDYESFAEVKRPFDLEEMPTLARQLIFNEPTTRIKMYREDSGTEIGHFGFQAVAKLCREVGLNFIIRSRHHVDNGIMWNENSRLISLWSAPGKSLGERGDETAKIAKYGAILELEIDEVACLAQRVYRISVQPKNTN